MPPPFSGLLVDRLAWGRRAAEISFAVAAGERVFVCGDGGSALLLTLAGFLPTLSGRVVCEGRELNAVPAATRHVAYIPGGDSLIGGRTLLANVRLAGADHAAATAALARFDLLDSGHRPAAELTAAQRRLGALARALTAQPALLLIDEAADDPPAIPERLQGQRPAALVATSNPSVALARAERILLLEAGRPTQFGTPRDLYERPASQAAASWSGDCNFVAATLDGPGPVAGSVRAVIGQTACAARFRDRASGPALLAIRPHRLRLAEQGVPATVLRVDYRGATTRLLLRAGETTLALDTADSGAASPGRPVHLAWDWPDAWPLPVPP